MIKVGDIVKLKSKQDSEDFGNVIKVSLGLGKAYISWYYVRSCRRDEGWFLLDDIMVCNEENRA
jgi:hypothetical protein